MNIIFFYEVNMKILTILVILLSSFFIFSCGTDSSSTDGISEQEYKNTEAVSFCEKVFECDIEALKGDKTDVSECQSETGSVTSHPGLKFDGVAAEECVACAEALSCDGFFSENGFPIITNNCSVCNSLYVAE
jgi:hypothetical protein